MISWLNFEELLIHNPIELINFSKSNIQVALSKKQYIDFFSNKAVYMGLYYSEEMDFCVMFYADPLQSSKSGEMYAEGYIDVDMKIYRVKVLSNVSISRFNSFDANFNLLTDTKEFKNKNLLGINQKTSIVSPYSTVMKDGKDTYLKFVSTADNQYWLDCYLKPDWSTTPPPDFIDANILPNSKYTFSFWAKGTGVHTVTAYDNWTTPPNIFRDFTLTNDWKFYSFTVTSSDTIPVKNVEFFLRCLTAGSEINLKKPKVEEGSIATPYMPSESEATSVDFPSYMGQYTDYTLEDSINPSSYTWTRIQGKYFYTLEDVNTNGTLKSYIIECLKLSLQTRWGNNLEYHIDRKTKYLNKLTGMQA